MTLILALNFLVLLGLLILLVRGEIHLRRLKGMIAATKADLTLVVHQLRTPLSTLRKFTDFLQEKEFGKLSLSQQEAMSSVQAALGETLLVLDRLLTRSRLDEGMGSDAAPVRLRALVSGVVDAIAPIARSKRQSLELLPGAEVSASTDTLLVHGILDELLSNAVHYTPDGGKITVSVRKKGAKAEIDVKDGGMGISDEEGPRIFEKYYRGERAKPLFDGNGLGLPFAQQFAAKLGGSVRFRSAEGKGSVFTLVLPVKAV